MGKYVTHTTWLPTSSATDAQLVFGLDTSSINTASINLFIARREGMVDSYLGKRWTTSEFASSPTVEMLTQDFVTYDIYNQLFNADGGLQEKPNIIENYDLALKILTDLNQGKADLFKSDGTRIEERNLDRRYWVSNKNHVPTFDESSDLTWRVSNSKLDDLRDLKEGDL